MSLIGKVALITGSSQGIGKATALRLANEGANVVINYASNASAANELVEQIGTDRAIAIQADVSSTSGLDILVDATVSKFGKIDILIPNAGILPMRDLEHTTEEDFDNVYNLMVKGPYFLAQKAAKYMPAGGRIIFVSTAVLGNSSVLPSYLLYGSAKSAIEGMTRIMAKDLGRKGIVVNAIAPGPIATDLFYKGKSPELIKMIEGSSPFNRIGETNEISSVMAFLSGQDSAWISGQVIRVSGAAV